MAIKGRQLTYDELIALVADMQGIIAKQREHIAQQDQRIEKLEGQLAAAWKHSGNSSKPPSSDITQPSVAKKRQRGGPKKRPIGGQQGHPKYESERTLDDADHIVEYHADQLVIHANRDLVSTSDYKPKMLFQYELVEKPIELTAYVSHPYLDSQTGELIYAPFPHEVERAGLLGPRLTAFVACLKGGMHASYTSTEKMLRFLGAVVCRATICNKIKKVAAALDFVHDELLSALSGQERINIDETSHKDHPFDKPADHKKHWIWVFATATFTVFRIFSTRSTDALRQVLGPDCQALIGADFYGAYRCFMKEAPIRVQFCWAHLIRDIKFLSENTNKTTANYGDRLLKLCRLIFHLQHQRQELGETLFRRRMARLKKKFLSTGRRSTAQGTQDMVIRLKGYGEEYFRFIENPQMEPTNNLAEREVRHCVIDRRITLGTRGHSGQRWCERIWTVLATCARQQRDAFGFVSESIRTYYAGEAQPSLLSTD